jgi:DNA-binding LacI/PurR family transcriptional regulator
VPLTTIRLPVRPFAEAAYQATTYRIEDPTIESRQIIIDVQLVARASTTGK